MAKASTATKTQAVKSKTKTLNKASSSGRKKCELGSNCPYQHEHQHQLEFYHSIDKTNPKKANTSNGPKEFKPFSGKGYKLSGVTSMTECRKSEK